MVLRFCAAAAVALIAAGPVQAATADYVGKWTCKIANRPAGGDSSQFWIYSFDMNLIAQGTFTASGTYENTLGALPFTLSEGEWKEEDGGLAAVGKPRMDMPGEMVLVVIAKPQPDGSLTGQHTSPYGTTLTHCQR